MCQTKINALNQRAACLNIAKVSAANKGIKKTVIGYLGVLCKCLCKIAYLIYCTVISFIGLYSYFSKEAKNKLSPSIALKSCLSLTGL